MSGQDIKRKRRSPRAIKAWGMFDRSTGTLMYNGMEYLKTGKTLYMVYKNKSQKITENEYYYPVLITPIITPAKKQRERE